MIVSDALPFERSFAISFSMVFSFSRDTIHNYYAEVLRRRVKCLVWLPMEWKESSSEFMWHWSSLNCWSPWFGPQAPFSSQLCWKIKHSWIAKFFVLATFSDKQLKILLFEIFYAVVGRIWHYTGIQRYTKHQGFLLGTVLNSPNY